MMISSHHIIITLFLGNSSLLTFLFNPPLTWTLYLNWWFTSDLSLCLHACLPRMSLFSCWTSLCAVAVVVESSTLCDTIDCSPPGSSVHGISQAGILEWVAISFSRGSFWCRGGTCTSWGQADSLPLSHQGNPIYIPVGLYATFADFPYRHMRVSWIVHSTQY